MIANLRSKMDMGKIIGENHRYYPSEAMKAYPPVTMAVLVEADIGDYACYIGHGTAEWVARFGDKISFEEACFHFPRGLVREKYRV